MTVDEWIAARKLPDDAAALVHVLVRVSTYANAPELLDAGAVVQQLQRALKGVRYLDGGWQGMVDGVAATAAAAGAEITDHVAVDRIVRAGDGWALSTAAGEVRARSVVLAAGGPRVAARLLGVELSAFGDPGPEARATCLELGLDTPPDIPVLFSTDAPLYFSTHMPPARLGPAGTTVVHVAKYLAPDATPSPEAGARELWDHAQGRAGRAGSASRNRAARRSRTTPECQAACRARAPNTSPGPRAPDRRAPTTRLRAAGQPLGARPRRAPHFGRVPPRPPC